MKKLHPPQPRDIKINDKNIKYILKTSPRARRMRLAIYGDGSFVVTRPRGLSENIVEEFIIQKADWIIKKRDHFKKFGGKIFKDKNDKAKYSMHKNEARVFIEERLKKFNEIYKFKYYRISIRNQKTRWGSCSKKGNLNFNYKILFLSPEIADYIIVHELCHLEEFNHSRNFWSLVSKAVPNYWEIKKELKQRGLKCF